MTKPISTTIHIETTIPEHYSRRQQVEILLRCKPSEQLNALKIQDIIYEAIQREYYIHGVLNDK